MPSFIPEWTKASARDLAVKRALQALDAQHVVRRPLRLDPQSPECPADFFVQRGEAHWLAVAIEAAPFEQIDPLQLFESPARTGLEQRLAGLAALGGERVRVESLVVLWGCSRDEARRLTSGYIGRYGVHMLSRDQFAERGAALVERLLSPVPREVAQSLMLRFFPEAEVPAVCTTRRFARRDTDATLARYFLDRQQEWATKLDLDLLPQERAQAASDLSLRLINGVAGSGKTLILLQRAQLLAKMFPKQDVLVLIHNAPVVADNLHRLRTLHGALPENLHIWTFYAWASRQWHRVFGRWPNIAPDFRVEEIVEPLARRRPGPGLDARQLADEFDFIDNRLIATQDDYLAASRSGRGFALRPAERVQVFALHAEYAAQLRRLGWRTWSDLPRELCLSAQAPQRLARYRHVLVDEAQFFTPSWFQLVKLSLEPASSLFLCADPTQGFLKHRLSWKSAGMDVSGRTLRLRKSYRCTRAILRAAQGVLAGVERADGDDFVEPDLDAMDEGSLPLLVRTDAAHDSVDRLVNEIEAIRREAGMPLAAMLALHGGKGLGDDLCQRLSERLGGRAVWALNEKSQRRAPPPGAQPDLLRVASVDSATGLEAAVVFLVGVDDLLDGVAPVGMPEGEKAAWTESHARKLYMAMTRAGRHLVLVNTRPLPARLRPLFSEQASAHASAPAMS